MANVKISELPVAPNVCQTGIVPIVQDGCTYSATAAQLSPMSTGFGACSIIGNGSFNTANGDCSFVAGSNNSASGIGSFVAGQSNSANADYSGAFGCGVNNNLPCTFMANNFVACDIMNCTFCPVCLDGSGKLSTFYLPPSLPPVFCESFGMSSIVSSAGFNQAYGLNSGSLGGTNNTACCDCATVLNGSFNISAGMNSFIGNGQSNCVCNSNLSSITNGSGNFINFANEAFIGTGLCNCVASEKSSIVGGEYNTVQSGGANGSFIGGGCCNSVSGLNSAVLGGFGNTAACTYTFVAGCGLFNNVANSFMVNDLVIGNFIGFDGCSVAIDGFGKLCVSAGGGGGVSSPMVSGGGLCSIVGYCGLNSAFSDYSFAGGGCSNTVFGCRSFLGGGNNNYIAGPNQVIGGGDFNCIGSCYPNATIGGGSYNQTTGFSLNAGVTIAGGVGNSTCGGSYDAVSNTWFSSPFPESMGALSFIGGGFQNVTFGCKSVVVGGMCNLNCGIGSFIGAGECNLNRSLCSFIGAGAVNQISCSGFSNAIITGYCNEILNGSYSSIGNGCSNTIGFMNFSACNNTIVSGNKGYIDGQFGFIGNTSDCSVFSCCSNTINCGTYGATILNGQCNSICGSFMPGMSNCFSAILGGECNTAGCNYNLLYGCGNSAYGDFVNVIGCGLLGMSSCTTYFNDVCVCGSLFKMSGSFKIPHPDPVKAEAGKFLKHSFVESPTAGDNIYRFKVSTTNLSATIELPDYYKFLNENDQVWVSAVGHFGIAYGTVNADQTAVDLVSNADGEFNVLLIGTRKDKIAKDYWNGIEVNEVENEEENQRLIALKAQMAIDNVRKAEEEAAYILEQNAKAEQEAKAEAEKV